MDVPSPPSASALGAPATSPASAPTVAIRNVLVILPSITRGFQPKNYNPPAYANIGRSPSLPTADMFFAHLKGSQADRLAKPRLSIAYGHAASLAPKQPLSGSPLQMRMMEGERLAEDLAGSDGDTTPPYPVSSGHLSPAARQEITAQLANPITPNSLPTDARRQSISTLLPAGVMSAKLSQLILEEEEANIRMEQARNSALGTTSSPTAFNTPYSMGGGRPETISEGAGEAESTSASAAGTTQSKRRPFPLARSTSNSASVSPSPSQLSPLHSTTPSPSTASANTPAPRTARRTRSRPQTSAAALNSAPVPAFGAKSNKLNASATSSSGSGSASGTTLAGSSKASEAMRPKRAVVSGAPGWEGEEIVNILREDGIQGKFSVSIY
ncbi:hypothetical protein QFC19_009176 [Naganishia cerealis]|uniref:Uncharacterized protein n=1 Tax=Naganishia cerealis TaxID=610337 RepID=A0ACC2UWY1_9TREE|nr:hypothetical protein QFC19_009176 [Naganishia cerealis]